MPKSASRYSKRTKRAPKRAPRRAPKRGSRAPKRGSRAPKRAPRRGSRAPRRKRPCPPGCAPIYEPEPMYEAPRAPRMPHTPLMIEDRHRTPLMIEDRRRTPLMIEDKPRTPKKSLPFIEQIKNFFTKSDRSLKRSDSEVSSQMVYPESPSLF